MKTREEALTYGLSFPDTYQDAPFRDANWQLVRVKKSKKVFLWTYEREGLLCLNVKVTPESRDFWRGIYDSVVPGWHQNKEHWNTIVLDGTIPDADVRKMIYESYELVTDNPTKRIYEAVKKIPKGHVATYGQVVAASIGVALMLTSSTSDRTHEIMRFIKIRTRIISLVSVWLTVRENFQGLLLLVVPMCRQNG